MIWDTAGQEEFDSITRWITHPEWKANVVIHIWTIFTPCSLQEFWTTEILHNQDASPDQMNFWKSGSDSKLPKEAVPTYSRRAITWPLGQKLLHKPI
jgi:hypothetical protein